MNPKHISSETTRDFLMGDELFLYDFFEHSPIGFHAFGPDRIIQAVNAAELAMLGYGREEIVGRKKWSDLIVPEQHAQFEQHWTDISTIGRVTNLRYTLLNKDGHKVEVVLNASARFDVQGQLVNTRGTVLDITHFRRANELSQDSVLSLQHEKQMLEKHNQALNALLANTELEKQSLKASVMANATQLVLPILKKLRRRGSPLDRRYLDLMEKNLGELTSSIGNELMNPRWGLSPREIEICNMIRSGATTKTIADTLCLSERTVEHHRNHIRKKLKLSKHNVNLVTFLEAL